MSIDDVYQSAECTRSAFSEMARAVVEAAGLDPDQVVEHDGEELMLTDELPFTRLCLAPPKGHARAAEKIRDDYDGDASRLVDVNRCSIVVDEQRSCECASKLMEGSLCEVVRLKNRFAEPLFNGYRDALYSGRACRVEIFPCAVIAMHLAASSPQRKDAPLPRWRRRAETNAFVCSMAWRAPTRSTREPSGHVDAIAIAAAHRLSPQVLPQLFCGLDGRGRFAHEGPHGHWHQPRQVLGRSSERPRGDVHGRPRSKDWRVLGVRRHGRI